MVHSEDNIWVGTGVKRAVCSYQSWGHLRSCPVAPRGEGMPISPSPIPHTAHNGLWQRWEAVSHGRSCHWTVSNHGWMWPEIHLSKWGKWSFSQQSRWEALETVQARDDDEPQKWEEEVKRGELVTDRVVGRCLRLVWWWWWCQSVTLVILAGEHIYRHSYCHQNVFFRLHLVWINGHPEHWDYDTVLSKMITVQDEWVW